MARLICSASTRRKRLDRWESRDRRRPGPTPASDAKTQAGQIITHIEHHLNKRESSVAQVHKAIRENR